MGYSHYTITRNGQEMSAGYSVETTCEEPGCSTKIDRGMAHLCGETPGGDESVCGGYFCGWHLYMPVAGHGSRCKRCVDH